MTFLDELRATCHICGTPLSVDESGCPECSKCSRKWLSSGDYEASAEWQITRIEKYKDITPVLDKRKVKAFDKAIRETSKRRDE